MTLIDRYLDTVRDYLPAGRQDDIVRELSEDLHSQKAEREDGLGRSLTVDEQASLLKQYGHPLVLASRYRPQRQLIGPALFPFYLLALKISLGVSLLIQVGFAISLTLAGTPLAGVLRPLGSFPFGAGVTVFAWVTLGFAIADLSLDTLRHPERWNPGSLQAPAKPSPRVQQIFELAAATGGFLWWLALPRYPILLLGPASAFARVAPIFDRLYLPITLLWFAGLLALWSLIVRTGWRRHRHAARIVLNLVGIGVGSIFLAADHLVVAVDPSSGDSVAHLVGVTDTAGRIGVALYIAFCVLEVVKAVRAHHRRVELVGDWQSR